MSAVLKHYDLWGSQLNITEWFWLTSTVAENTLYINGGEYYNRPNVSNSDTNMITVDGTYQIDLTKSWTNESITGNFIPQPDSESVRRPMLWYSDASQTLYRYGGWPYETGDYQDYVWDIQNVNAGSANTTALSWQTFNGGLGAGSVALGGSGYTSTNSSFYALGGADPQTFSLGYEGLLAFTDSNNSFTNSSSVGATTNGFSLHAGTAFASFGPAGYLAFVGGTTGETNPGVTTPAQLIPMSSVSLYSLETQTWYSQPVTGDIPPPRSAFCYVSARTNQTLELFIYGGSIDWDTDNANPNEPGFTSVYVLSLPAFRWFKGPTPSSSDSVSIRRAANHCTVIGNRQMFSLGGQFPGDPSQVLGNYIDPWPNGIGVFDMTEMQWVGQYDPNAAAYESPAMVQEYYTTNYTPPAFVNQVLSKDFAYRNGSTGSSGRAGSGGSTGPKTSTKSSHSNTGAIVGGVIGGIAALLIVAIGLLWLRRQRKSRPAISSHQSEENRGAIEKPAYGDSAEVSSELDVQNSIRKSGLAEIDTRPHTMEQRPYELPS